MQDELIIDDQLEEHGCNSPYPLVHKVDEDRINELFELHNSSCEIDNWEYSRFEEIFFHKLPVLAISHEDKLIASLIYLSCLDEARIINICVHPHYRRLGHAQQLMLKLREEAIESQLRYVLLDVRVGNYKAINLYTQLGFRILDRRKNYYTYNEYIEDSYLMQMAL